MKNKIIAAVALVAILTAIIIFDCTKVEEDPTAKQVGSLATSLYNLQKKKQDCKNSLTYLESRQDYMWTQTYCDEDDSQIEMLKFQLNEAFTFEYQRVDSIVDEELKAKEEDEFNSIVDWTGSATEKLEQLLGFKIAE